MAAGLTVIATLMSGPAGYPCEYVVGVMDPGRPTEKDMHCGQTSVARFESKTPGGRSILNVALCSAHARETYPLEYEQAIRGANSAH